MASWVACLGCLACSRSSNISGNQAVGKREVKKRDQAPCRVARQPNGRNKAWQG